MTPFPHSAMQERSMRLKSFSDEVRKQMPDVEHELVRKISDLMDLSFRAGLDVSEAIRFFDPDERSPALPIRAHDIPSGCSEALGRLRMEYFGRPYPFQTDLYRDTIVRTSILEPENLFLRRDATLWRHGHGPMRDPFYTDAEITPLIGAGLFRKVGKPDGEWLLLTRWGFEFLCAGSTLGNVNDRNIYQKAYLDLLKRVPATAG